VGRLVAAHGVCVLRRLGRAVAANGLDARDRDAAAGGGLRWPWALVLLAAAFVVTLLDPWALTQPGFWLSFMAVGC
jgi:competence protein ComEC